MNHYFLCNSLSKGQAVSHDQARMGRLADSAPMDKSSLLMRTQWSCKVVSTEVQSVNASKADRIAFLPVCTLRHTGSGAKELKKNSMGLSLGCLSVPEFLLLGSESLEKGDSPPACLFPTGVWKAEEGCLGPGPSLSRSQEVGAGGCLMNTKTGLLLCCPRCRSFPSCIACPLTKFFMALGLAPDLSQTCQQLVFGFFLWTLSYRNFPWVARKTAWWNVFWLVRHVRNSDKLSRNRPPSFNLTVQITRVWQKQHSTGPQTYEQ